MRILRNMPLRNTSSASCRNFTNWPNQNSKSSTSDQVRFADNSDCVLSKQYSASGGVLFIPYKTLYIRLNIYCAYAHPTTSTGILKIYDNGTQTPHCTCCLPDFGSSFRTPMHGANRFETESRPTNRPSTPKPEDYTIQQETRPP